MKPLLIATALILFIASGVVGLVFHQKVLASYCASGYHWDPCNVSPRLVYCSEPMANQGSCFQEGEYPSWVLGMALPFILGVTLTGLAFLREDLEAKE